MTNGPKAGFKSSEFWLLIVRLLIGAGLTVYEPTRELGAALLGLGGKDGTDYLKARTELKKNGGGA